METDISSIMRESGFPYKRIAAFCDKTALSENLKRLRAKLPEGVQFCAVVKADAYGHGFAGLKDVFECYADQYAVASVEEGEALRALGVEKPVLILGDVHRDEYSRVIAGRLSAAISSADEAEQLSALALNPKETLSFKAAFKHKEISNPKATFPQKAHVQIAVDTGMSRIGLMPDAEGLSQLRRIAALPGIVIDGTFTHFATADEADLSDAEQQLGKFEAFLAAAEAEGIELGVRHCANSAAILNGFGILRRDETVRSFDMARGGIAMYGLYPSEEVKQDLTLHPVMQLGAYLTHVKEIEAGTKISYGGLFQADRNMRIGTVSCGYADGYPRSAGAKSLGEGTKKIGTESPAMDSPSIGSPTMDVLVRGQRCPIVGRVCMDQMMIDLSRVPEAQKGDPVVLIGRDGREELTFYELAEKSGGFHYELLCSISKRVPRVYIG